MSLHQVSALIDYDLQLIAEMKALAPKVNITSKAQFDIDVVCPCCDDSGGTVYSILDIDLDKVRYIAIDTLNIDVCVCIP